MKIPLSLAIVEIFLVWCDAYSPISKGSNYLQFLRAQKFMQIQNKNTKLYQNFSEDLDELDALEEEQEKSTTTETNNNLDTLEFKNVEAQLKKNNEEYNIDQSMGSGRACTISEKGLLDVSINDQNIFNVQNYLVQIANSSIIVTENEKNGNVIKSIPFDSIKLPLETIEETRECWKLKTSTENIMFCEKNKQERDIWMQNILKALFCYNTNNLRIGTNLFEKSDTIELPKESTVERRLQESRNNNNAILQNKNHRHHLNQSNSNTEYTSEDITDFDLPLN